MNINLNFKTRFAPDVKAGKKRQTIRLRGKRQAHPGDVLHLFTGMRTKQCERLGDAPCLMVVDIDIDTRAHLTYIEEKVASMSIVNEIARRDGFDGQAGFYSFFRQQYGEGRHQMILYRW